MLNLLFVFARLLVEFDRETLVQRTFVDWFSRARGMGEDIASERLAGHLSVQENEEVLLNKVLVNYFLRPPRIPRERLVYIVPNVGLS